MHVDKFCFCKYKDISGHGKVLIYLQKHTLIMTDSEIISLVKREVVPAIGCTEPMAVALCVAHAVETLGCRPESLDIRLSANILKNAMGVGIPGTGMIGLPIAVALGALVGRSAYGLEVLKDTTPQAVEDGKKFIAQGRIHIALEDKTDEKLYIDVRCCAGTSSARATIAREHTLLVYLEADGMVLCDRMDLLGGQETGQEEEELTLRRVYDFATTAPLEDIEFINEAARLNREASQQALKGNYGHDLGKTLSRPMGRGVMGDSIFSHTSKKVYTLTNYVIFTSII